MKRGTSTSALPPSPPAVDVRALAKLYHDELATFLASYWAQAPTRPNTTALGKFAKLTDQQLHELSTDVYDELTRRGRNPFEDPVPFLPPRGDFHPKRNQARQRLSVLSAERFQHLASDVYLELVRRYPELKEGGLEIKGGQAPAVQGDVVDAPSHVRRRAGHAKRSSYERLDG